MTCLSAYRQNHGMNGGFTLIELLVVLVILALAMSVAVPALFEANERARLEGATMQVYDGLRRARSQAVTSGDPVTLDVRQLVKDRAIKISLPVEPLIFYPDGSATRARFSLLLGEQRRSLSIDWLTGHAALVE